MNERWWICTDALSRGGEKILGPSPGPVRVSMTTSGGDDPTVNRTAAASLVACGAACHMYAVGGVALTDDGRALARIVRSRFVALEGGA